MALDGKQVFEIISSIAADEEKRDEITVLPLMCGSGKSTAISYMIKKTIEEANDTGNGLLVVTDRKDRMADYMEPHDDVLRSYLTEHQNEVVIMIHENVQEAHARKNNAPVLMMTTQRYFKLTGEEIEEYLGWKDGRRTLIILDEYPELMTVVDLDDKKLSECKVALKNAFHSEYYYPPINELESLERFYTSFINELRKEPAGNLPKVNCVWSWYTEENKLSSMINPDDPDFLDNLQDEEFQLIERNREKVNRYGGGTYYDDIYTRMRAIHQLKSKNALLSQQKNAKLATWFNSMYMLLDNYAKVKDINSKVIILDGTAKISPEYLIHDYSYAGDEITRPLNNLHINLVNIPTGKTALLYSTALQQRVLERFAMYYEDTINPDKQISESDLALFTYMDFENTVKRRFKGIKTEHFGNIKGKNDFREMTHIVQIGLNRYSQEIYYLFYLEKHPEIYKTYSNMEEAYNHIEIPVGPIDEGTIEYNGPTDLCKDTLDSEKIIEQSKTIIDQMKDVEGETSDIMNRILLAEIEQNMFRGKIRISSYTGDYYYHLFINTNNYSKLIEMMRARYEPLGATIQIVESPEKLLLSKIMQRHGDTYAKKYVEWHDTVLKDEEEYSPDTIRDAIGIVGTNARARYERMLNDNPILRVLMLEEKKKRGQYIKKGNWYYVD